MEQVFKDSGDGKTRDCLSWEAMPVWMRTRIYLAAPNDTDTGLCVVRRTGSLSDASAPWLRN
jgi:hypothetical protein